MAFAIRSAVATMVLAMASAGCGSDDEGSGAGGTGNGGTSGSGGSSTGGTSSGGTSSGGASTGGTSSGGSGGGSAAGGGIAEKYPGDQGIETDPDVIFADDFESYATADDLWDRWDNTYQQAQTHFATGGSAFAGNQSIEFTMPQGNSELSNAIQKKLTTELDQLYLRWYSKFDPANDIVGSSHNGGGMSAHYFGPNGEATPGVPANGTNKFLMEFEHWRGEASTASPGQMNVYIYHPAQRDDYGDHFFPSGIVLPNSSLPFDFGPDFQAMPEITPELDKWYCYELMVKANTVGQKDGRVTLWLDGKQIADFGNLHLRDVDTLKLDRFNLSFHAGQNPSAETKKYYDNVVAAKSYIGPMAPP
jgi:hypothetical protein